MPTNTYTALATITLGSTDSEVVFASIPASYRDLVIVISGTTNTGTNIGWKPNGDTSNHSGVYASGSGSGSGSSGTLFAGQIGFLYTTQGDVIAQVMDYSATDKHKTILARANNAGNQTQMLAGRWASNTAISSIGLVAFGNSFAIGSTFSLYGIAS